MLHASNAPSAQHRAIALFRAVNSAMKKAWRLEDRHTAAFSGCKSVATIVVRIEVGRREGLVCRQVRACHRRLTTSPPGRAPQISNSTAYSVPFQHIRLLSAQLARVASVGRPSMLGGGLRGSYASLAVRRWDVDVSVGRLGGSDVVDSWH